MAAMATNQFICVYCGSGKGLNPVYAAAARTLGAALAADGIGLVYGGGGLGLMGEVARAVLAGGGRVIGIIPEFLVRRELMLTEVSELIVTANMHERKMTMFANRRLRCPARRHGHAGGADRGFHLGAARTAFKAHRPRQHRQLWALLIKLIAHMRTEQFVRAGLEVHFDVVDSAEAILPAFKRRLARPRHVPGEADITRKF